MGNALDRIARMAGAADADTCPWGAMRAQHTAAIRAQLTESGAAAATVNQALAALRGTLTAAWRLGQLTAEELARATDVKSVKAERCEAATGRAVTYGEAMALAAACNDGTPAGMRDSAILAVAYACGLRRAEIAALDMADYTMSNGRIMVSAGKGNKQRELFVDNGAKRALDTWLALRGPGAGAIFTPIRRGGHIAGGSMTAQAIYNVIVGRCESANVEGVTPHDFRRTFIGELLDAGVDLATVATLAGHSDPATTARYDRRGSRARQQAASRIHWPAGK
jgi:integrase